MRGATRCYMLYHILATSECGDYRLRHGRCSTLSANPLLRRLRGTPRTISRQRTTPRCTKYQKGLPNRNKYQMVRAPRLPSPKARKGSGSSPGPRTDTEGAFGEAAIAALVLVFAQWRVRRSSEADGARWCAGRRLKLCSWQEALARIRTYQTCGTVTKSTRCLNENNTGHKSACWYFRKLFAPSSENLPLVNTHLRLPGLARQIQAEVRAGQRHREVVLL